MISSPAFDYNIMLSESLIDDVTAKYGDILSSTEITYNPPNKLYVCFVIKKLDFWYHAIVKWFAQNNKDLFNITDDIWDFILLKQQIDSDICTELDKKDKVSNQYILQCLGDYLAETKID